MSAKKLSFLLLLILTSWKVSADKVKVELSTANVARVGQQIRLAIATNEEADKVKLPNLSPLEVLMGPMTSSSSSIQIINGRSSRNNSYTYTYIVRSSKAGIFTIPSVDVIINGKTYKTQTKKIEIIKGNASANTTSSGSEIEKKDLFVKVLLSRTKVKEGEAILATTKLYTRVPISGVSNIEIPSFTGFYTKPVEDIRRLTLKQESYNDDIYNTAILNKTLLFPQKSGKIKIEPAKITVQVQQRIRRSQDFFDDFFNSTRTVSVDIKSPTRVIHATALPAAPQSYSGGVGSFDISASISDTKVKANDAITLKLTIKGKGNLSLVTAPKLNFPSDFETYDPQNKSRIKVTSSGEVGNKTLEYLVQPRFAGTFTIPSVDFSYYDPAKGTYITKSTKSFTIEVAPGEEKALAVSSNMSNVNKEVIKTVGEDIRFISTDKVRFKKNNQFFGTPLFYLLYVLALAIFVILYLLNLKKIREREDVWGTKNKKANKLALRRLKQAATHLKQNEDEKFYEAMLVALMGYLEDKLTLPKSELTKDTIKEKLTAKQVDSQDIEALSSLIDTCEFARYAPSQDHNIQEEVYKKALNILSIMEKTIKK
ncbi:MAG: BatD family protein [Prolixibacteraceae bacterium]